MLTPRPAPEIDVFRRRENNGEPLDDRRLRRRIEAQELIRIGPGSVVSTEAWGALSAMDRHYVRVCEAAARVQPGTVFAFHAAAAVWGIDKLGWWPRRIDVTVPPERSGRSGGLICRHSADLDTIAVVPWGAHFLTTPAQTVVDIAAAEPVLDGVVAADQALWSRRVGGPLTTVDEIAAAAAHHRRGAVRLRRVIRFARPGADSVRESESRVVIDALGFPEPLLQQRFDLPGGTAYSDFYFPSHDHVGEFDGAEKYRDAGCCTDARRPRRSSREATRGRAPPGRDGVLPVGRARALRTPSPLRHPHRRRPAVIQTPPGSLTCAFTAICDRFLAELL